jgi:hypothetical protein
MSLEDLFPEEETNYTDIDETSDAEATPETDVNTEANCQHKTKSSFSWFKNKNRNRDKNRVQTKSIKSKSSKSKVVTKRVSGEANVWVSYGGWILAAFSLSLLTFWIVLGVKI